MISSALRRLASGAILPIAVAAISGACSSGAPQPAPVTPRTSINALMVTMVDNAGHVLWDAEKPELAPKNDADWLEIQDHAIQLAAASTIIQLGGTGQADMGWVKQVGWASHSTAMGDAALGALAAAKAKDLPALVKANGALVETCEGCHKAFKPSLPSEGIVHQRPHSESHP
jgi:cytochrome c556